MITPAGQELLKAINREITVNGEARCVKRIVEAHCTLPLQYAYKLLKANSDKWGLTQERIPCQTGGYVKRIRKDKNNDKC